MAEILNLVFDLDGTLIDSVPQIHATANKLFQDNGLQPFSHATVRSFVGNGVGVLVSRLMAQAGLAETAELHADLVARFISAYEESFDLTTLYPGAAEALAELAGSGHHLAICTNKPLGPTRAVLRHFGLTDSFPVVIGGDSLPQRKPDPAPLQAVLAALGPRKALFIGDSEVDAATAKAAGVPLALFTGGYRAAAVEDLGAKLIFDAHAALPRLIRHLSPRL